MSGKRIFVTGAGGYLGRHLVAALAARLAAGEIEAVVAADVRPAIITVPGVRYLEWDVRNAGLGALLREHGIDTVVHLASIVTPGKQSNRAFEYSVDVDGSTRVLEACIEAAVRHIVISSSGAAYGYHADNPAWLRESDPVRGNEVFAYSWHKRLVENVLADYRVKHPELKQTIFRIGTILGAGVKNQITDLFDKPRLIAIRGSDSPFVFIWDQDVVGAMLQAISSGRAGIFNLAGDGVLTVHEIARRLGKGTVNLPAGLLRFALALLKPLNLTQYGPEQLDFLRYRPVLDNTALKRDFGYVPAKTSAEVFEFWRAAKEQQ